MPLIAPGEMVLIEFVKMCWQASRERGATAASAEAAEPAS